MTFQQEQLSFATTGIASSSTSGKSMMMLFVVFSLFFVSLVGAQPNTAQCTTTENGQVCIGQVCPPNFRQMSINALQLCTSGNIAGLQNSGNTFTICGLAESDIPPCGTSTPVVSPTAPTPTAPTLTAPTPTAPTLTAPAPTVAPISSGTPPPVPSPDTSCDFVPGFGRINNAGDCSDACQFFGFSGGLSFQDQKTSTNGATTRTTSCSCGFGGNTQICELVSTNNPTSVTTDASSALATFTTATNGAAALISSFIFTMMALVFEG